MEKMKKRLIEGDTSDATNVEQVIVDAWTGNQSNVKSHMDQQKIDELILGIRKELGSKSKDAERIGAGNFATTKTWVEITNKSSDVPKTDIVLSGNNISVKYGPSQLMSGFKEESLATFVVAANKSGLSEKAINEARGYFDKFAQNQRTLGYPMTTGDVAKMSPEEAKRTGNEAAKNVIDQSKILHKQFTAYINSLFDSSTNFKMEFMKEAMSGFEKFSDKKAVAEYVLAISKKTPGKFSLSRSDDRAYLSYILGKTKLNVSFKSASYKIKGQKAGYAFSDVIRIELKEARRLRENISKLERLEKSKVLNEGAIDNLINKIKAGISKIKDWILNLPLLIEKVFNWIKGKLINLLQFFGLMPDINLDNNIDFYNASTQLENKSMNEKQLREMIRKEIRSIKEAAPAKKGPRWTTKNFDEKEFYNFWSDVKHVHDDWGDFMTLCNKGKFKDAEFALKIGLDSLIDMKDVIDKMIKAAQAELKEKNFYNN